MLPEPAAACAGHTPMKNTKMKIGLLDHMGYGNLGDAATQDVLIANIRSRLPEADIIGFSLNPDDTTKRHGITCYSITYWHPGLRVSSQATSNRTGLRMRLTSICTRIPVLSRVARRWLHVSREVAHLGRSFRILRSLDTLIIAGGGQLSEFWGGAWSHPYNVLKFSVLTKLAGRRLIFLNVGSEPLKIRLSRTFVRWSVRMADYVSFRDIESQALVCGSVVKRQTFVFPDSVYAIDVSGYSAGYRTRPPKLLVGINPIGFCDPRLWPRKDAAVYDDYIDKLAEFSRWLMGLNYRVRIFSAEASVDAYAIEDLRQRFRNSLPHAEFDEMFTPPSESVTGLIAEMSTFDFVVTSKFHGVVFSHLLAKPVVALSYHPKIPSLMRTVGHDRYCLDVATFDYRSLQDAFAALVRDGPELKATFRRTAASYSDALRTQFDGLFASEGLQLRSQSSEQEQNEAVVGEST